jgi:hypothetical protein
LAAALALNGFVMQDGILSEVISTRGGVSRVRVVGRKKISYVLERDGVTAHGETLQLARADLLFKLGKRDTSIYKAWNRKTKKPIVEMIAAYRAITGACGQGVQHFLNGKKYEDAVSVEFVITETRGQYGHEQFASFFAQ